MEKRERERERKNKIELYKQQKNHKNYMITTILPRQTKT